MSLRINLKIMLKRIHRGDGKKFPLTIVFCEGVSQTVSVVWVFEHRDPGGVPFPEHTLGATGIE
jgi:hypothetical protein